MSTKNGPDYSLDGAVSLIVTAYRTDGASIDFEAMRKSFVEEETGLEVKGWNAGIFRMLDELIYLTNIISLFSETLPLTSPKLIAQTALIQEASANLLAIRTLCAHGLDNPARKNLRAFYEECHALCRSMIDTNFCNAFVEQSDVESANIFWHDYMSKGKTEKYLREYSKRNPERPCMLVVGDIFAEAYKVLGVGAHPNFFGWLAQYEPLGATRKSEKMFTNDSDDATELVLFNAIRLSSLTLAFISPIVSENIISIGFLDKNPLFSHHGSDTKAICSIGSTAALLFLLSVKWSNRAKPEFDPDTHY